MRPKRFELGDRSATAGSDLPGIFCCASQTILARISLPAYFPFSSPIRAMNTLYAVPSSDRGGRISCIWVRWSSVAYPQVEVIQLEA